MSSGGMSAVARLRASTFTRARSRNSSSDSSIIKWRVIARSGQSTCSTIPALWISSYSGFMASESAKT